MIIATKRGKILNNCERRIAFPINVEGVTQDRFADIVARLYWPELRSPHKIGDVLSRTVNGIEFYAICCHSLQTGWYDQEGIITECFNSIPGDDPVASVAIGTDHSDISTGANIDLIQAGMQSSSKRIILYYDRM